MTRVYKALFPSHPTPFLQIASYDQLGLSLPTQLLQIACARVFAGRFLRCHVISVIGLFWVNLTWVHRALFPLVPTPFLQIESVRVCAGTGWRRLIGSPKLQIIFHIRATKYRALLRKMTYKDKGSYESSPPCSFSWCCIMSVIGVFYMKIKSVYRFLFPSPPTQLLQIAFARVFAGRFLWSFVISLMGLSWVNITWIYRAPDCVCLRTRR